MNESIALVKYENINDIRDINTVNTNTNLITSVLLRLRQQ